MQAICGGIASANSVHDARGKPPCKSDATLDKAAVSAGGCGAIVRVAVALSAIESVSIVDVCSICQAESPARSTLSPSPANGSASIHAAQALQPSAKRLCRRSGTEVHEQHAQLQVRKQSSVLTILSPLLVVLLPHSVCACIDSLQRGGLQRSAPHMHACELNCGTVTVIRRQHELQLPSAPPRAVCSAIGARAARTVSVQAWQCQNCGIGDSQQRSLRALLRLRPRSAAATSPPHGGAAEPTVHAFGAAAVQALGMDVADWQEVVAAGGSQSNAHLVSRSGLLADALLFRAPDANAAPGGECTLCCSVMSVSAC